MAQRSDSRASKQTLIRSPKNQAHGLGKVASPGARQATRFTVKTSSASTVFGRPQAADAEMVNDPWQNLTNAVSPLPVSGGAASRINRWKVNDLRSESGRSCSEIGGVPVLRGGCPQREE